MIFLRVEGHTLDNCKALSRGTELIEINQGLLFFDLMTGGWILVSTVLATTDPKNANPPGMAPWFIGLSATAVGLSYGSRSGGAANPARYFGPRLMALLIWGEQGLVFIFYVRLLYFFRYISLGCFFLWSTCIYICILLWGDLVI